MAVSMVSVRIPTGDTPFTDVTLEPYVLVKRGETTVTADDIPEEGSGEGGAIQLRSRWYRSCIPTRGAAQCSVHPDKEAVLQCTICLRCKVAQHLSYHCAVECFRNSWHQHKEHHRQAIANGGARGGVFLFFWFVFLARLGHVSRRASGCAVGRRWSLH
jgi:CCR4-NOT transcription complex subunit 6